MDGTVRSANLHLFWLFPGNFMQTLRTKALPGIFPGKVAAAFLFQFHPHAGARKGMEAFEFFPATGTFFFHSANLNRTKRFFAYFRGVFPGLARPTASPP